MSEELVYKNAKKDFLDSIKSHMSKQGFQEVDEDIFYERVIVVRQPSQTISINGQVMHQPGKEIEIKHTVCFSGDGWVANQDESNKMDFTQVIFETYQGKDLVMQHEDLFYWDEQNHFVNVFNQAFNR